MHKVRTVEQIKIRIGNKILARGEKELEKNLTKLPWHAYYPVDTILDYNLPNIIAKSYRSNIFHERKLVEILRKFLSLMPIRKQYKELR
jgi:hypothetical protein